LNFEEIYQAYFRDVLLYVCSLSNNADIAEEITQETFVKALKAIDRFDGSKDIRAWLFTIAKNTYFTYCRKKHILVETVDSHLEEKQTDITITESLINEESAFLVHQFLHTMEEPYKEVFHLRVFGELSFDKIGILFGKNSGWARVTFYRAKKKILEYMEEIQYDEL
jgi:RNA polymerase sigma-70 factor (ECF subfamily)